MGWVRENVWEANCGAVKTMFSRNFTKKKKEKNQEVLIYVCYFMTSDCFLVSVCCLSRIIVMVIIITGKYCVPAVWQVWLF